MEDFKTFWEKNQVKLIRHCASRVGIDDAEDLMVEIWMKCKDKKPDNWWPYIYKTSQNIHIDWILQKKRDADLADKHYSIYLNPDDTARKYFNYLLESNALCSIEKQVIDLTLEGKTQPEIAEELNLSVRTIKRVYKDAIQKSKILYQRYLRDSND